MTFLTDTMKENGFLYYELVVLQIKQVCCGWVLQTGYPTLLAFATFVGQFEANSLPEQRDPKVGRRDDGIDRGKPFAPAMFDAVLRNFSPDQPSRVGRQRYSVVFHEIMILVVKLK